MKNRFFLILGLLCLIACTDGVSPDSPNPNPGPDHETALTLISSSVMEFSADAGDGEIAYKLENPKESVNLTATCVAHWVRDVTVGDKITFSLTPNREDTREAKIVVKYDNLSFEVLIRQLKEGEAPDKPQDPNENNPKLTLMSEATMEFSSEGGQGEISYKLENPKEGVNLTATCASYWVDDITVDDKITFNVRYNSSEAREAKIVVKYDSESFEVAIKQLAKGDNTTNPDNYDLTASGSTLGYDYVDLGLSVKWATYNVGAESLTDVGEYYAWGETTPYDRNLTFINYEWLHIPCSPDCVLASIYDTATVNWGKSWRMPTSDEQDELIKNCNWVWVENLNGSSISGYVGTSKKNGKSIFLPASQYIANNDQPSSYDAVYWSSSVLSIAGRLGFSSGSTAECIKFKQLGMSNPVELTIWPMGNGATVRPVLGTPNDYFPDPSTNVIDESETDKQGFTVNGKVGSYTYVDLGLPSRTMWATYNVGAKSPGEYGDYFAWGETSPKDTYTEENYYYFAGYEDSTTAYPQYTKYVWDKKYGSTDGKYTLDASDDAASVNWGNGWCMPTAEQVEELERYCSFWRMDITVNGKTIIGCVGESNINGNRIFLPAAGWEYSTQPNSHLWVWYWTSDVSRKINARAKYMLFLEDEKRLACEDGTNRCQGLTVRAVVVKK